MARWHSKTGNAKSEPSKPSIVKVLIFYGADQADMPSGSTGWRPIHCPFHEDKTKSASVNTTLDGFACMACGIKGDSWSLIMDREGVKFAEAIEFANREFGGSYTSVRRPAKQRRSYKPSWT